MPPREADNCETDHFETDPPETNPRETNPREAEPRETEPRETEPRQQQTLPLSRRAATRSRPTAGSTSNARRARRTAGAPRRVTSTTSRLLRACARSPRTIRSTARGKISVISRAGMRRLPRSKGGHRHPTETRRESKERQIPGLRPTSPPGRRVSQSRTPCLPATARRCPRCGSAPPPILEG